MSLITIMRSKYRELFHTTSQKLRHDHIFSSIKPKDIVIDCGANVGDVTSRFANKKATIFAFEPHKDAYRVLTSRFAQYPNITCFQKAVGPENTTTKLYRHKKEDKDAVKWSVGASTIANKGNISQENYFTVESIDLSKFIMSLGEYIKVLKLDVEGAEYEVLTKMIRDKTHYMCGAILVETHERIPSLLPKHKKLLSLIQKENAHNIFLDWK